MKRLIGCSIIYLLFLAELVAQPFAIGRSTVTLQDPSRNNRAIPIEIYYPAQQAGANTTWADGDYPMIIFGHGFAMTYSAYENITSQFVPKGYIFAFLNTENGLASVSHPDFAADFVFAKQNLTLPGNTNGVRGFMGHSMGGGAAFLAAASVPDLDFLITMAPAETNPSAISASSSVTSPTLVFSGERDAVTPPASNHLPMFEGCGSTCKVFVNVLGGAHCYFAQTNFLCDFGETTSGSNPSISRAEQQDIFYDVAELFLRSACQSDENAWISLGDSVTTSNRIEGQIICDSGVILADQEPSKTKVLIFPQPAFDQLFISSKLNGYLTYSIYDLQGRKLLQGRTKDDQFIDISKLNSGMYSLTWEQATETNNQMIIVLH